MIVYWSFLSIGKQLKANNFHQSIKFNYKNLTHISQSILLRVQFLSHPRARLILISTLLILAPQKSMKKSTSYKESSEQFQDFVKNIADVQRLLLQRCESPRKQRQPSSPKLKSLRIQELQQKCEQYELEKVKTKAELTCFKNKTVLMLSKCKMYEQTLFYIVREFRNYLGKLENSCELSVSGLGDQGASQGWDEESGFLDEDSGEICVEELWNFVKDGLRVIYEGGGDVKTCGKEETEANMEVERLNKQLEQLKLKYSSLQSQTSLKIAQLQAQLETQHKTHLTIQAQSSQKLSEATQKLSQLSSQLSTHLQTQSAQQQNYTQLLQNLEISTKNRSQVIILFKGLYKKQREHQRICPMYGRGHANGVGAEELLRYEEERKKSFGERKKMLENVLNF